MMILSQICIIWDKLILWKNILMHLMCYTHGWRFKNCRLLVFFVFGFLIDLQMFVRVFKLVTLRHYRTLLFPKTILPKVTSTTTTSNNPNVHTLHPTKSTSLPSVSNSIPTLLFVGLLPTPSTRTPFEPFASDIPPQKKFKSMIAKTLNEKRAKGLCFLCDEKFVPRHKSKKR